jgi:amino acid transporter
MRGPCHQNARLLPAPPGATPQTPTGIVTDRPPHPSGFEPNGPLELHAAETRAALCHKTAERDSYTQAPSRVTADRALLKCHGEQHLERGVGKSAIVVALLAVFAVFIIATLTELNPICSPPSGYPSLRAIIASVALTFFAYLGFSVISFAAEDLPNPARNLPRAMYISLGGTTALYVAISVGVFGTLTVAEVTKYGATAVAEAARPALGDAGFTAVTIASLLATSSSVNATLYASKGFTGTLARVGQFPPLFGQQSRLGRHGGLVITVALILLFVNLFNLSAIASVGSAVSLSVFVLVGIAGYRLRDQIKGRRGILALAVAAAGFVLGFFVIDTLRNDPSTFAAIVVLVVLAIALDFAWKRAKLKTESDPDIRA